MSEAQRALGMIPTAQEDTQNTAAKLLELQKAATAMQREDKNAEWAGINTYNQAEIPPVMMAKLYSALYSLTIPHALMLAITAHRRGLNPEDGDIYVLPSGKIGTSLQGTLKEAKLNGYKLSAPVFTDVEREWPKGATFQPRIAGTKEIGVKCNMTINDQPVEYTAWLTNWFMEKNPNWSSRSDWMLRVSAQKRCLALGTGIGVSEDIVDVDATSPAVKMVEPKAPKEIPSGIK
jgi:hypothetical protein